MDPSNPAPSSTPAAAPAAPSNLLSGAQSPGAAQAAAVAAGGTPAPRSWTNDDGTFSEGWIDLLGPEYADGKSTLATIKGVPMLAKAYLDTKKMVGAKQLAPPGEGATPEQITAWRKLVGAPENEDDYGALMPEGFTKELWSEDMEREAKKIASKHHISIAALKEFAGLTGKSTVAAYQREVAAAQSALQKGQSDLRTAWGPDFDRRASEARAMATALGIDESDDIFVSRPDLLQKLAAAAPQLLGQDKLVTGTPASIGGGIQERINAIRDSADYQGRNGSARQQAAAQQMRQLIAAMDKVAA